MNGKTNDTPTTLTGVRTWRIQIFFLMLCSRICCSSENAWICFTLKFRKRRKREFQLLLFHSVMHQRQCGIIEKSNFVWTKFPCVIPVQQIQGQAQTVSTWNFLILLFAYLSLCRLHDGKSLPAISKSPLDRQQLGHPWGSKTESSSVTSWTYNGVHHHPPKTLQ